MTAPLILCLVACIGLGIYALYLRNLERTDFAEYHIAHGPASNCLECADK